MYLKINRHSLVPMLSMAFIQFTCQGEAEWLGHPVRMGQEWDGSG